MAGSRQKLVARVLLFVFIIVCLTAKIDRIFAISLSLQINEVYYDPTTDLGGDTKGEWFELYNAGGDIDINGWTISDNFSTKNLSTTSRIIPAGSFILIIHNEEILSSWNVDTLKPDIVVIKLNPWFSGGLSDSGDRLVLKDANDNIVDSISWGNDKVYFDLPDIVQGHAYNRSILGLDLDQPADFIDRTKPTPGREYAKEIYPDNIAISEIVPWPDNGSDNEFIEIYNTGASTIDLVDWQIDDDIGGSPPYRILNAAIAPGQYLAFYNQETKIALNDSGDKVRLLDPDGEIKAEISYAKAQKGQSYSFVNSAWYWNSTLTPASVNLLILNMINESNQNDVPVSINSAREQAITKK